MGQIQIFLRSYKRLARSQRSSTSILLGTALGIVAKTDTVPMPKMNFRYKGNTDFRPAAVITRLFAETIVGRNVGPCSCHHGSLVLRVIVSRQLLPEKRTDSKIGDEKKFEVATGSLNSEIGERNVDEFATRSLEVGRVKLFD